MRLRQRKLNSGKIRLLSVEACPPRHPGGLPLWDRVAEKASPAKVKRVANVYFLGLAFDAKAVEAPETPHRERLLRPAKPCVRGDGGRLEPPSLILHVRTLLRG